MRVTASGFVSWSLLRRTTLVAAFGVAVHPAAARSQDLQAQASVVVAFVTDTAGHPLEGAEVQVVGTSLRGNTDGKGRVALLAVPAGKAVLRVRRLGFAEQTIPISVTPGSLDEGRYKLLPIATDLTSVTVHASELKPDRYAKTGRFDDFYRRRSEGLGTFLTREDIDARAAEKSQDLLRSVSGIRIRYEGTNAHIEFVRCSQVNVYIDGVLSHDGYRDFLSLSPLDIEAMEVYHGLATVPPEFSPHPNDCAAVVIWTRWHGAQK
jgi:carboxypeptidase family protein/TonB-dependent receptor-like protein